MAEAMASDGEDVYATLLLTNSYLPGALVVAHSLRDAGTTKKLAVLITEDTVSLDAISQLRAIYDYIIPVERVVNQSPGNLFLMNRADLHSTFTKINLWKLVQFRKIVFVDADMVSIRAPDELFNLPHNFSAAPDIGWPDIFNSGFMVLTPNMGDYYALLAMAQRGISFDGADQGLLNMHFKNDFNRISFTYNVTPSAHYQYLPAYRHFQSRISMGHFIGHDKPWTMGREANRGSNPYDEMVGRWWAVYDRHYREFSVESTPQGASTIVHCHTKGEFQPIPPPIVASDHNQEYQPDQYSEGYREPPYTETRRESGSVYTTTRSDSEIIHATAETPSHEFVEFAPALEEAYVQPAGTNVEQGKENEKEREIQYSTWDASRAPPPSDSRPEASNFPAMHYEMSSDPTPFKAPPRYPDPPKDMWYEVPKTPSYQQPAPIFPWEKDAQKPTRVFPEDNPQVTEPASSAIDFGADPSSSSPEAHSPATPTILVTPNDVWQTYTRGNAWDDIPEIERYIGALQKNRKGNLQVLQGYGSGIEPDSIPGARRQSTRLTDFPTELERPSLPVTPAPIRRPNFWGEERNEEGELPAAEGVPTQEEWDPTEQLEQLARRQSEILASKLGKAREIPSRPLPYGSEGVKSPTYVAQAPPASSTSAILVSTPGIMFQEPSYQGPGATFEKDETFPAKSTPEPATEEELDALN
ncbi:nucleotide-diphospho-sugar transferase [Amylocarpus encephaloides]|uniref:glycogenin glucosyltransferase n=1 Tax=Amylocarpus encephaloides TaxID=45428 RepID=A0A9P7YPC7_9HELO|nr:nucleotide-diphospho-sugar transferase [Amylocarpus encephaloides]